MGEFRKLKRSAPRGRSVMFSQFLCDAIHKFIRAPKKMIKALVDGCLEQLIKMISEDGIDIVIKGLGRFSAEPLEGRECILTKHNIATEYPPGSFKLRFIQTKAIKAKSRPRFLKRIDGSVQVLEWYKHLYNSDGTPNYDVDQTTFFDSGLVAKKMLESMSRIRNKKDG